MCGHRATRAHSWGHSARDPEHRPECPRVSGHHARGSAFGVVRADAASGCIERSIRCAGAAPEWDRRLRRCRCRGEPAYSIISGSEWHSVQERAISFGDRRTRDNRDRGRSCARLSRCARFHATGRIHVVRGDRGRRRDVRGDAALLGAVSAAASRSRSERQLGSTSSRRFDARAGAAVRTRGSARPPA